MILAAAGQATEPGFNGLYFATAATVIPVLFLAIAVQGDMYKGLLKTAVRSAEASRSRGRVPYAAATLVGLSAVIVFYGAAGEIAALIALWLQRAGTWEAFVANPLVVGILVVFAAAGPARAAVISSIGIATQGGNLTWTGEPKNTQPPAPSADAAPPPPPGAADFEDSGDTGEGPQVPG